MENRTLADFSDGSSDEFEYSDFGGEAYKSKQKLRWLYEEKQNSQADIAELLGVSTSTIRRWLIKHNIERKSGEELVELSKKKQEEENQHKAYADEELLRRLHHHEGLSFGEISRKFDVTRGAISYWFDKLDIEKRTVHIKYQDFELAGHQSSMSGYPSIRVSGNYIFEHQLVALAKGIDPKKIFNTTKYNIHHKNGMKCDNRPSNLIVMESSEHGRKSLELNQRDTTLYTEEEVQSLLYFALGLAPESNSN